MARRDPFLEQLRQLLRAFGQGNHTAGRIGCRCRPYNCKGALRPYALTFQSSSQAQYAVAAIRRIEDLLEFQQLRVNPVNRSRVHTDEARPAIDPDHGP